MNGRRPGYYLNDHTLDKYNYDEELIYTMSYYHKIDSISLLIGIIYKLSLAHTSSAGLTALPPPPLWGASWSCLSQAWLAKPGLADDDFIEFFI